MFRSLSIRKHGLGIFIILAAIVWIATGAGQPHYDVKEVSTQEAKSMMDSGAVVVDVRGPESFKSGHIPNSIPMPLEVLRVGIPASIQMLKGKSLIIYCGDGVRRGPESTDLLNKAGFAKAVNLKHGVEGWTGAGYPLQKG